MKWVVLWAAVATAGCSSHVVVRDLDVPRPPPASPAKVDLRVDMSANNAQGEAVALETGLQRELAEAGFECLAGNMVLTAEIILLHRGNTFANSFFGMGIGADYADVRVRVSDPMGAPHMSFVVRGVVVDKRYRELNEVLHRFVAKRIVEEIATAGRRTPTEPPKQDPN
jgi:hypothetical protein